ncbi:prepilin peptidase [Wenzhouxiangella sediminis]|nr:prepilin peptidase [Wenzhouxiangella sediminis]
MTEARDHCPDCGHKLHPQELEALFSGSKLDCWYCTAPLKARAQGHLGFLTQTAVAMIPLVDSLMGNDPPEWLGFALAGLIVLAIQVLPPGLVHGAPWVRIVNRKAQTALPQE